MKHLDIVTITVLFLALSISYRGWSLASLTRSQKHKLSRWSQFWMVCACVEALRLVGVLLGVL